ncbi:MAG: hypothetical protein ACO4CZ_15130 [Planctomycetota bacterium]
MGNVAQSSLRVQSPLLQAFAKGAVQDDSAFVADRCMAASGAQIQMSGLGTDVVLQVQDPRNFLGNPENNNVRAPGDDRNSLGRRFPSTPVTCSIQDYSIHDIVDRLEIAAAMNVTDLLTDRSAEIARAVKIAREKRFLDIVLGTSVVSWGNAALSAITGGSGVKFGASGSQPIKDFTRVRELVRLKAFGAYPDTMVIGHAAAVPLIFDAQIQGAVLLNSGTAGVTSRDAVAQMLAEDMTAVEKVLSARLKMNVFIASAMYESANLGIATNVADIAPDSFWMGCLGNANVVRTRTGAKLRRVAVVECVHTEDTAGDVNWYDGLGRKVYVDSIREYKALDTTSAAFGYLVTDCV